MLALVASLIACADMSITKNASEIRVPIGVGFGISDIPCQEFKSHILPARLESLDVTFEWTDEQEGLLSVGPIIEEGQSGGDFLRIRQIFFLNVACIDELTTHITGNASIEGYGGSGEWIWIAEPVIVEQYGLRLLQGLGL